MSEPTIDDYKILLRDYNILGKRVDKQLEEITELKKVLSELKGSE